MEGLTKTFFYNKKSFISIQSDEGIEFILLIRKPLKEPTSNHE